jgi:putative GTP pyrophosphokinase
MNKQEFFKRYPNLNINEFDQSNLQWDDLVDIYNDYQESLDEFNEEAEYLFRKVIKFKKVHSCKFRVKDPEHLIEKIIRKNIKGGELVTKENYRDKFHDLIGLRAIHLYKEDWEHINDQIYKKWSSNFIGLPYAYIRKGDSLEFISKFENIEGKGEVREHQFGYRSIHYIICITRDNKKYYAELQVRTIFEEGWSEIDHDIKYPYNLDNQLYGNYLGILNRLAGASDEMATMLKFIDRDQKGKLEYIEELKEEISDLNNSQLIYQTRVDQLIEENTELKEKIDKSFWNRLKVFILSIIDFFRRK